MSPLNIDIADLVPFADLGTDVQQVDTGFILQRNGAVVRLESRGAGYLLHMEDHSVHSYPSAVAVLSGATFAGLARIAENQAIMLSPHRIAGRPVPIAADLTEVVGNGPLLPSEERPWIALDTWLSARHKSQDRDSTEILLVDGPAGVGKTTIIREVANLRAERYDGSSSLVIQIASRGRVLQNISDLIAFALQDIRANLTIGQLLVLMRHGQITLAIDGFDELSDPNGFQTAWSGLNNLIKEARGSATFILAGRETFVSADTIRSQLTSFEDSRDRLSRLSLGDPTPESARDWLLSRDGWDASLLNRDFVEPIFVKNSYALRPFFLDVIAREPAALRDNEPPASDLLSYLVETMVRREAAKFVESLDPPNSDKAITVYGSYVARFLEEIARDFAENQSDSIADEALDLLATVAAHDIIPNDQIAAVVQRARTVVFLANDVRSGHVRFAHEQIQEHFLAREALRSIGEGELPRYVRRNIFGRDSLEVFSHVARGRPAEADAFLDAVRANIGKPSRDRTDVNLSVLGIAVACGSAPDDADLHVHDVSIGELHFPFSPPSGISFEDTVISILRSASADLRLVDFRNGVDIATLETDRQTILPEKMPLPHVLVSHQKTIADRNEIERILRPSTPKDMRSLLTWPDGVEDLLGRIGRYRPFWLRTSIEDTDKQGRHIISHPAWPVLYESLKDLSLITVRSRAAAGTRAEFVHFKQDSTLLEEASLNQDLRDKLG